MFSALNLGSLIYVLDKTDKPKLSIGEITGITLPKFNTSGTMTVDIKVKMDGNVYDYNNILSNSSLTSYNNGKLIISETKQGLQNEVESILLNSRNILNNIDYYKDTVAECESILKELNPSYARDIERDEDINHLKGQIQGLEGKMDEILTLLSNKK